MPFRALLAVSLVCLLLGSLFLLLIFGLTPYQKVQALGNITYHEGSYHHLRLALTPARYTVLRGTLAGVMLLSGGLLLAFRRYGLLRQQWQLLQLEIRQAGAALRHQLLALSRTEKWAGSCLLLALLLVRIWYLAVYPISTDEAASFDYFIHEGPVAISSFYPIPNNHLLFNFLCWPFSLVSADLRLAMRLPTLLAATAGTGVAYLLLTRAIGFRGATLGVGLFGFSPLGLYYAVAGRGYFLQLALLLVAFFAALALWRQPNGRRLAWVVFIGTGILGLYTIPTFVYPLVALGAGLLLGFASQRRWPDIGRLALAAATIGTTAVLLYSPVIIVSGLSQLLGNRYVARLAAATFWPHFAGYLHVLADTLAGGENLGLAAVGALSVAVPLLWWRQPPLRPIITLMALLLLVPVVLMALQQVLVPERVLLFAACFSSILLGLAGSKALNFCRITAGAQLAVMLLLIGGYAGYVQWRQLPSWRAEQQRQQQIESSYEWLTGWGAQRVFLASPWHELFLHHYALLENRNILLQTTAAPDVTYDFVVLERGAALPAWAASSYSPVYEDALTVIYGPANAAQPVR
ncbi:hypothetical protein KBK19_16730 [Microvirga sp. STR05]|uniref:Glycosyltransferase RgtA/B/C/D-like domain-containing protein n=1 Tax=Hymenobacter duratus TaxID=2771356 RepID=A0ABR8JIJ9_9BACT|nr:hypothetical protein [Hymenobacter duratus]MBD2716692.1 hypothetical protein [Hymenobacter duratus]MBR7951607.1 hypothetical protein [Microvirga sp. STR05]